MSGPVKLAVAGLLFKVSAAISVLIVIAKVW